MRWGTASGTGQSRADGALRTSTPEAESGNHADAFVAVLSPDGTVIEMNGAPPGVAVTADLLDKKLWDTAPWADSLSLSMRVKEVCERAARGHSSRQSIDLAIGEGQHHTVDCRIVPLRDAQSRISHLVATVSDITEERQYERALAASRAELKLVADTAAVMLAHWDRDRRYLFVNKAYADHLGLLPEAFIGKRLGQVVGGPVYERLAAHVDRALAGETIHFEIEVPKRWSGPESLYCAYVPDIDPETGAVLGFVAAITKVTELRALEAQLRQADRRKDEFLAILAHELRNPLAPLRHVCRLLQSAQLAEDKRQWGYQVIDRQVRHMARLLDDLLDISRITHGRLIVRKEPTDLNVAVSAAVEVARSLIEAHRHQLIVDLPDTPVRLQADPVRLAQIITNLLTNAAKYTDDGGRIELRARTQDQQLVLSVRDTGIGLSAEALSGIFEIFSQVKPHGQRSEGGLGVGLSLVRGLVNLHGGSVQARSEGPGRGSEFIVHLPLQEPIATVESRPDAQRSTAIARRRLTILVADDNRDAAESLSLFLKLEGHEVTIALNGADALEAAGRIHPNVCLLDIGMPFLSGYEVAQRIRAQPWGDRIVLIAVTGWGQEEEQRNALRAGFDHHLTKPADLTRLQSLIQSDRIDQVRGAPVN